MTLPVNFEDLIAKANALKLYRKLIIQLNKDLLFANIDLEFDADTLPTSLKLILQETVFNLIRHKFSDYLNLLYQIDVSEQKIKSLDSSNMVRLSEDVTFLILRREWQKVWYKSNFI